MIEKYRLVFDNDSTVKLDDMLWVFNNFTIGISKTPQHFVMNHYSNDIDKKYYEKVDLDYNFKDLSRDWIFWFTEDYCKEEIV